MQNNTHALELEATLDPITNWDSAEAILMSKNIPLDQDTIKNLNRILEKGVEKTDELIDQIPYIFVIKNDSVQIQLKHNKWITLTKKTLEKLAEFA